MKNKYLYILFILSVFILSLVHISIAQDMSLTDSLKQELKSTDDSSKILILNKLCWELRNSEIQNSIT